MVYYAQGMELEVVSRLLHGSVNDVVVCRDRLSPSGTMYTLLEVYDRSCARNMMTVLEENCRIGEDPCLLRFAQNESILFLYPYREERKLSMFAPGQMVSARERELTAIHLVMECLSVALPWPLLYLVLEQGGVQIAKDNSVYFTMALDLSELEPKRTERDCVYSCARLLLELLNGSAGRRRRRRPLKSLKLIYKKTLKNAYTCFPELYQDIRVTALPPTRVSLMSRVQSFWWEHRDQLFRLLLILCVLLTIGAGIVLVSQMIFGDVPLLRLFRHCFDVIGTENLHRGGSL